MAGPLDFELEEFEHHVSRLLWLETVGEYGMEVGVTCYDIMILPRKMLTLT